MRPVYSLYLDAADTSETASQAICLRDFQRNYGHRDSAFDDQREMQLVLEVADIIDELKILRSLFEKQGLVIASLSSTLGWTKTPRHGPNREISSHGSSRIANARDHNESVIAVLSNLDTEAKETYRAVRDDCMMRSGRCTDDFEAHGTARPQVKDGKFGGSSRNNETRQRRHALYDRDDHIREW